MSMNGVRRKRVLSTGRSCCAGFATPAQPRYEGPRAARRGACWACGGGRRSAQHHTTPIRERGRASSFVDFPPRPITSRIRRLDPATAARLRSSPCVPTAVSAVSELVLNSIDAGPPPSRPGSTFTRSRLLSPTTGVE